MQCYEAFAIRIKNLQEKFLYSIRCIEETLLDIKEPEKFHEKMINL